MESRDEAQALDMPNGLSPEVNYHQNFVHAPDPNRPGPRNHEAMRCPSVEEVMKGIYME